MRGPVSAGPPVPVSAAYRVSGAVPAIYREDPLFAALCAALDDLLAPVVTALDCFDAYLDAWLAPPDFLAWLGALVGVDGELAELGEPAGRTGSDGPERYPRGRVAGAVDSYRRAGTPVGMRAAAAGAAGVDPDRVLLVEPGGVAWSTSADPVPPAPAGPDGSPTVLVRVTLPAGPAPDRVAAAVRAALLPDLPVHCRLQVECERGDEVVTT